MLEEIFNLSGFSGLSKVFPVVNTLQLLLILLANETFHNKMEILQENAVLGSSAIVNLDDLGCFISLPTSASILDNIIKYEPFQHHKSLIYQALQTFQRGPSLDLLPLRTRSAVEKVLQHFMDEAMSDTDVRPAVVRL